MKRAALSLLALPLLAGCGLHPLYAGGGSGVVSQSLGQVEVDEVQGKGGWLITNALRDRLGAVGNGAARYRLTVKLDDQITGLGVRRDNSVTRERRTLRARYQLIDLKQGTTVLDATAGSDAGIDVVTSEYAVIAAEDTALERLSSVVADQIVTRLALYARNTATPAPDGNVKATQAQIQTALDRASGDIRLYLLHGPDEAGASALAARLGKALGADAERVDLEPSTLRSDPARLTDEAAALSLFGDRRYVRVTGAGEESVDAVEALLAAPVAGNPVVILAPSAKATGKLVKLALASPAAMSFACYAPEGGNAESLVATLARDVGLRLTAGVAARIARASEGDRAIMASEVEKLALYLDAAPERPAEAQLADVAAIGAAIDEAEIGAVVEAVIAGAPGAVAEALRPMQGADASPIPWLRALVRRLSALMEMRAEMDRGEGAAAVVKRHRVFWREEATTIAALERWTLPALTRAHVAARAAERDAMRTGAAARAITDQRLVMMARAQTHSRQWS